MLQHPQEKPKHPDSTPQKEFLENTIGESDVNCTESDTEQSADAFAADAETAASTTAVPFKLAS